MYLHHLLYLNGIIGLAGAVVAPCYAPDGSLAPGTGYLPCVATLNVDSMCCVLNSTALTQAGGTISGEDTCLVNGLCLEGTERTRRTFCTDKTWKSANCLGVCIGGTSGGNANTDITLTHCTDGSWCCGTNNLTSCCNLNLGFKIPASIPPYAASATSASIATATVTTTSTPTPVAGQSAGSNGLGIGLGVALGVVLIAAGVLGFLLYRRHRGRRQDDDSRTPGAVALGYYAPKTEPGDTTSPNEVPSWREPVEISGDAREPIRIE